MLAGIRGERGCNDMIRTEWGVRSTPGAAEGRRRSSGGRNLVGRSQPRDRLAEVIQPGPPCSLEDSGVYSILCRVVQLIGPYRSEAAIPRSPSQVREQDPARSGKAFKASPDYAADRVAVAAFHPHSRRLAWPSRSRRFARRRARPRCRASPDDSEKQKGLGEGRLRDRRTTHSRRSGLPNSRLPCLRSAS